MKNEYDNEIFFNQYAMMPRSKEGLSAAGEWHQLKPLFPTLRGKSLLDVLSVVRIANFLIDPKICAACYWNGVNRNNCYGRSKLRVKEG